MTRPSFSIYNASAGSGKTYALVKEYLKIILNAKQNDAYRNILAITFTNKAVQEMKLRIVGNLTKFSKDNPEQETLDLMQDLSQDLGLSIEEIKIKSQKIIKHIIHNYAAFDIATIDKFTYKVIRTFAHDLGLPMTFEVSLDTENLLTEAVDSLIAEAGNDAVLTNLLVDFTLEKTDDDKSWDISREIFETGKLILNENNRTEIAHFENKKIDGETLNRILQKKAIDNKDLEKQISNLSKYNTSDATTKAIAELQLYKETIDKQTKIIEDLQTQLVNERSDKEYQLSIIADLKFGKEQAETKIKDAELKIVEAEKETEKVREEKKIVEDNLIFEQKKGAFQGALLGTDKERIIGLQHQIYHSSARINRSLDLLLKHLGPSIIDDKTSKYIKLIALEASKINSIANFVTKANFNLKASEITEDLIEFIKGYINEIYLFDDKIIKIEMKISFKDNTNKEFVKEFKPLEITTIVDNFISNAEKAGATELVFNFSDLGNNLEIDIKDNGKGILEENLSKVFDLGYTTTNGSGIGLFQTYDIITNNLKGKISVTSIKDKSTNFKITLK